MKLSYNAETHRRCLVCGPTGAQLPLRKIVAMFVHNRTAILECGHYDHSIEAFREMHPEWFWETTT